MGTIVENIRKIGIFMIAAQAVMHFAPGRQYEKYIKLIAGVMILLLFVNPFADIEEDFIEEWERGEEQIMEKLDAQKMEQGYLELSENTGVWNTAMQKIEEEVQSRLNLALEKEPYRVTEVEIQLEQSADVEKEDGEWSVEHVRIVMEKRSELPETEGKEDTVTPIKIEEIDITSETVHQENVDEETDYKALFADTLGIEEDKVEVVYHGGW